MLRWFQPKATCPVNDEMRDWIDWRWDWLERQFGRERLRQRPIVLPNSIFFPETFEPNENGARRLLDHLCGYMDVTPATVEFFVFTDHLNDYVTGNGNAAGVYQREGNAHHIGVEYRTLADPFGLIATLVHELAHVHLLGSGRIADDEEDGEMLTDLLTVYFGLGVFTANAVIREQYRSYGHHTSWSIGRAGYLSMPDFGYSLALFARARGDDGAEWAGHLRLDVRTAFRQAMRFLADGDARSM